MLHTYEDLVAYVNEVGLLLFSGGGPAGIPSIGDVTREEQWHSGSEATDPWRWKERAVTEKALAFGNVLGGRKGFLSFALYPLFVAAYTPPRSLEERYEEGLVSRATWQVWQLFQEGDVYTTFQVRKAMGVTKKQGASPVDRALVTLQQEFLVSVCGNRQKIGRDGLPYGWSSNAYCRTDTYAPQCLAQAEGLGRREAEEKIYDHCARLDPAADRAALSKWLFGKGGCE